MKLKNKGKVYPSSPEMEALKLLPAAILALAALLSLEDREVLAYLISRSLKTNPSSVVQDPKKKSSKAAAAAQPHKPARFECECFDCYTSYWFRWDSSPNRELINQAIEAFEDHLASGEKSKRTARGKRRDKNTRPVVPTEKLDDVPLSPPMPEVPPSGRTESIPVNEVLPPVADSPERSREEEVAEEEAASNEEKGRKAMPDVLGSIKSRIWGLWNPNV